jgi:hypothetical protein
MPLDNPDITEETLALSHHDKLIVHAVDLCVLSSSRLLELFYKSLDSPFRVADWHVVYSKHL